MKKRLNILFICFIGIQVSYYLISLEVWYNTIFYSVLTIFLLLTYGQILSYVKVLVRDAHKNTELKAMKQQEQLKAEQEQMLISRRQETLALQHKTIDNLEMLRRDLKEQNYDKIREYLPAITDAFQRERFHPICQDNLINAVLAGKRDLAGQSGILVSYEILLPEHIDIAASDLSSVFFNLMDNGIEGCKNSGADAPLIHLSSGTAVGFLVIRMYNTRNPNQIFDRQTSKADALDHGFGLSIIEDICVKYDGSCQWRDNGDTFESLVMLRYEHTDSH